MIKKNTYLLKRLIENELYVKEYAPLVSEKCQPSYISNLPGNLKTSTSDELQHRLDVIDEKIDEFQELADSEAWIQEDRQKTIDTLTSENDELQQKIDACEVLEDEFGNISSQLQRDTLDKVQGIMDKYHSAFEGMDYDKATLNGKPNMLYSDVMSLTDMFEHTGFVGGADAKGLKDLASKILDIADTPDMPKSWQNQVVSIANDIYSISETNDINKHPAGDMIGELYGMDGLQHKAEWEKQIKDNNTEIQRSRDVQEDSRKQQADFENRVSKLQDEKKRTSNAKDRKDKQE